MQVGFYILFWTISELFQIIVTGQIFAFDWGTHSFIVKIENEDHEIWPQETRNIALSCFVDMLRWLFRFATIHAFDRQTDRRTDGQKIDSKSAL